MKGILFLSAVLLFYACEIGSNPTGIVSNCYSGTETQSHNIGTPYHELRDYHATVQIDRIAGDSVFITRTHQDEYSNDTMRFGARMRRSGDDDYYLEIPPYTDSTIRGGPVTCEGDGKLDKTEVYTSDYFDYVDYRLVYTIRFNVQGNMVTYTFEGN
jgi:hypothetical protein